MKEHYYTEKPTAKHKPFTWKTTLRGVELTFTTDVGVFSKENVDFGTRLLIETFVFPEEHGAILDIGCGYGAIGLALAKSEPKRDIVMADVNERAVHLAQKNATANCARNVSVLKSDLFTAVPNCRYAAILSNPPIRAGKKVVYQLFADAYDYLQTGGFFWVVIRKKQGAPSAKKKLMSLFSHVDVLRKKKGYYIIVCKK